MIKKILIANRGEIALRIQRTAKKMGIATVAVHATEDSNAAFVNEADEAFLLTGNSLAETYLNIDKIIKVAVEVNANAIHPGYGFLSENAAFVEACNKAGIIFIGPNAKAMQSMGNKIAARKTALDAGVPVTPGITGTTEYLLSNYERIGLPILIKAAAGGGGKGMRVVNDASEMKTTLEATAREAKNYFGDKTVYIEKYVAEPRHIEVQVLGDQHGNLIHLYERECSLQRRHQKIIEEAPSITLSENTRKEICNAAVTLAKSIGYYSAGTMEFLLDENESFYFLEMNTRIQVEHPVTELTTGIDIVEQQIRIANGESLSFNQDEINQNGHAIECRIYAEDPELQFLPSPGLIKYYKEPSLQLAQDDKMPTSQIVRIDGMHLKSGDVISGDYDPMISKLIVWAATREEARLTTLWALYVYQINGIKTNISFLISLLKHEVYIQNKFSTKYLDNHLEEILSFTNSLKSGVDSSIPIAAVLVRSFESKKSEPKTIWQTIGYWRALNDIEIIIDGTKKQISSIKNNNGVTTFLYDNNLNEASLHGDKNGILFLLLNGKEYPINIFELKAGNYKVNYQGLKYVVTRTDMSAVDDEIFTQALSANVASGNITSPMPGKVIKINVQVNDKVNKGDILLIVEAMKMENNIVSPLDAVVEKISVKEQDKVSTSDVLVQLKTIDEM